MSVYQAQVNFINASKFAVIGRTLTDRQKWDNKILRWYKDHNLVVTPVSPPQAKPQVSEAEDLATVSSALELPDLSQTSISIIISPHLGLDILESLYPQPSSSVTTNRITRSQSTTSIIGNGPKGVWFQPGAESDEIRAYVKELGLEGKVICAGNHECILVEGDELLKSRKAKL